MKTMAKIHWSHCYPETFIEGPLWPRAVRIGGITQGNSVE